MRLGFNLPQLGPAASGENMVRAAQRAEQLGYDSVWTTERLLFPVNPRTPYAGTPDGSLPDPYKVQYDPLESLLFVAAHTERVALGTSVLDIPFYNPVLLARRITSIDQFSGGRMRVGMGLGWSADEYEATGADPRVRGRRADEFVRVLKAIWTADPVEFKGEFFTVPKSIIQPKPVQKPHPPVYLAAFTPGGLKRAATLADGWLPVGVPVEGMKQMMAGIRSMAKEAGRNPDELEMVVRANIDVTDAPLGTDRWIFTGSADQVRGDIDAVRAAGAAEVHFDPAFSDAGRSIDGFLSTMERMRELAG